MIPVSHVPAICWMLNLLMNKKETLILGVGNPLRRDDGIGPEVIRRLTSGIHTYNLPAGTDLIDGGTDGLGLIEYLKEYKKVFLIDAVDMGLPPGTVKIFTPAEAVLNICTDSLSTHGFGIAELIKFSKELDINPELFIIGIQPENISIGEGLSESIEPRIKMIMELIISSCNPSRS